ncbi:MAG: GNAT family N-acetyltransferase [Firmicutes bacterium HGW-Firmicutes-11]|jgi:ribosomal protein S18 acetylase RimI-like enzyme|nr:MAG: GNAT family N-acetyltransferase [Firmicutes bacterium HGW-Firmicutes-11]
MAQMQMLTFEQKKDLTRVDHDSIRELELLCCSGDQITLKLEIDFKLTDVELKVPEDRGSDVDEFLCYDEGHLIGYIGICSFDGLIDPPELTGMVHPDHRRKKIFSHLHRLVMEECKRRNFKTVLLLCDRNSSSGRAFLERVGAVYSYSEYEMHYQGGALEDPIEHQKDISLRRTSNVEEEAKLGMEIWIPEKDGMIVGGVHLHLKDGVGSIYGLSVSPENRGKGYGRPILRKAIDILREAEAQDILLQVDTKNWIAHNLYKSCGFVETSVMDYFTLENTNTLE